MTHLDLPAGSPPENNPAVLAAEEAEHYRAFIRHSSDGIWRFELEQPIDTALPPEEQVRLMFQRAYVAECNDAMARMYGFEEARELLGRRLGQFHAEDSIESRTFLLGFVHSGYRLTDVESRELDRHGNPRIFVNSFVGVVECGRLLRAWGTQRDVTQQRSAEAAVRENEERLRLGLMAGGVGTWDWDIKSDRVTWSDRLYEIHDVPPGSFGGTVQDFTRLVHPDDRPMVAEAMRRVMQEEATYEVEFRSILPDGSVRWLATTGRVLFDERGNPVRMLGATTDVTHRRGAEEALRLSEHRYRRLVEQSPLSTQVFAPDGSMREANAAWEKLWGVTPAGLGPYNILEDPQLEAAGVMGQVRRAFAGETAIIEPLPYVPDRGEYAGQTRWCGAIMYPLKGQRSEIVEVVLVHNDVTAQREAEERLRASEARLRAIVEQATAGIAQTDLNGRFEFVNRRFCQIVGYEPAELLSMRMQDLTHPEDLPRNLAHFEPTTREGGSFVIEKRYLRRDGTPVWVSNSVSAVLGANSYPQSVLAVVVDITSRKQAEAELRRAKEAAEEASAAKDQFLAVLSHELRTPLAPVLLTVSLMEHDAELPERFREDVQTIRRNVDMEARLIDDLLDLTRITRGLLQLDLQTCDVHLLIRAAQDICCRDAGAPLTLELAATHRFVRADPARLQQVFWNLLNNARKFTPVDGSIVVRTNDAPGGHIRIAVEDSGVGIAPDLLPRVFNAFEQGSTRRFGGLGLGLAICKALAEVHGGTITAHSAGVGKGAQFIVELPVVAAELAARHVPPDDHATPPGLRIMLVEDHGPTARAMRKLLTSLGHRVSSAASLADARQALHGGTFDLLISDLGLPDGSGHDLMREVSRRGQVPVGIALSGYGMDEDLKRSAQAGFSAHLTKPVDLARLQSTIARVTAMSPAGRGDF